MHSEHHTIWARHALTASGWKSSVLVQIDDAGRITEVSDNQVAQGVCVGVLLPGVANLHSHAFQRAMAGMSESRGSDPGDSFWTWRKLMYGFLQHLDPDDAESIAAFGQMEMLESGYTSVGEFHYLHHQPDGSPYGHRAEMCERMVAAATSSGIGMTLLPVLYEQGGCDGRALVGGQKRFGNSMDDFAALFSEAASVVENGPPGTSIGIAPHSLRAVSQASLKNALALADGRPFHIHVAEQDAEVTEVQHAMHARPVQWLLDNHDVDSSWCLVHATQMQAEETTALAASGATVGLCPITESSLGDGIFDGVRYLQNAGGYGIGTDSNVRISLSEELRTLEYSQRLEHKGRVMLSDGEHSCGRTLFDAASSGGSQALQRRTGAIQAGFTADLIALDADAVNFTAVSGDGILDAWIFASDDRVVSDVWARGQHLVTNGIHVQREQIENAYRKTLASLLAKL